MSPQFFFFFLFSLSLSDWVLEYVYVVSGSVCGLIPSRRKFVQIFCLDSCIFVAYLIHLTFSLCIWFDGRSPKKMMVDSLRFSLYACRSVGQRKKNKHFINIIQLFGVLPPFIFMFICFRICFNQMGNSIIAYAKKENLIEFFFCV